MIGRLKLYQSASVDPYYNLAVEQYLLETVAEGEAVLYLWQNRNTVVIGRNQNPWKECRTTLLSEEGGHLARRLSGGGAVFHDLGNLNFTFLIPQSAYNLDRQFAVIGEAVASFGIRTEKSGRNDMLAEGRKFSGNAFYKNGKQAYHHGTLLVDVDMERMTRYLNPSKAKLQAKGVDSVRSRVVNLRELCPHVTIDAMKAAMAEAFGKVYGLAVEPIRREDLDQEAIDALYQRNRSWEWNFGQKMPFSFTCEEKFPWGLLQVEAQVENGVIDRLRVFSDAMDWQVAPRLEQTLTGVTFTMEAMIRALRESGLVEAEDMIAMLAKQNI